MKFFNCLVKLGGDPVLMTAPRLHISEDEVRLLRHIHGDDAVLHLSQIGESEVDRATHLYQLARFYNDKKMVETVFRVSLDNFEGWLEEALQFEDQEREQRQQAAQFSVVNKTKPSISEGGSLLAMQAASRGADPNSNNTEGVAAAARKLEESAASQTSETAASPATPATLGKRKAVD